MALGAGSGPEGACRVRVAVWVGPGPETQATWSKPTAIVTTSRWKRARITCPPVGGVCKGDVFPARLVRPSAVALPTRGAILGAVRRSVGEVAIRIERQELIGRASCRERVSDTV